jgi:hypothetical protein
MKTLVVLLVSQAVFSSAVGAASFQNIGFDGARTDLISEPPPTTASRATLIPGWDLSQGGVGWNYSQSFSGKASILDRDFRETHFGAKAPKPVVGNFSLGVWPDWSNQQPTVLRQTGDIPADALSLTFLHAGPQGEIVPGNGFPNQGQALQVLIDGSPAPIVAWKDEPSGNPDVPVFHYFAVNVSAWAGQTKEIRFEFRTFGWDDSTGVPNSFGLPNASMHVLDDLQFQAFAIVPEPQTWALFGVGAAAIFFSACRKN